MPSGTRLRRQIFADARAGALFCRGAMRAIKDFFKGFTVVEYLLLIGSTLAILLSFFLCGNTDYLSLAASLIGIFSLILASKGDVLGHLFTVIFSALYGAISYYASSYGEMITYLGMTAPMAIISAIAWLRHPHKGKRREVEVNSLKTKDYALCLLLTACVTTSFYFILRALGTASLIWSTVSVATSFVAVFMSMRRSPLYALAYAVNDIVLIVLWSIQAGIDRNAICMIVCFSAFLLNDIYGFINWRRIRRRQLRDRSGE